MIFRITGIKHKIPVVHKIKVTKYNKNIRLDL